MAVIIVERQRRIFRRHLHVLRLLRRRRRVLLIGGGNLLRRRPHRRTAGTALSLCAVRTGLVSCIRGNAAFCNAANFDST
jgi:hypothetical protein